MKVGDKIEILETSNDYHRFWKKGQIYKITRVDNKNNAFSCINSKGDSNGWGIDRIKYKILNQLNYYFY